MRLDTKQLYFVFVLIALKINASLVNETNELYSLEREVLSSSLDTSPNIGYTTGGKKYLVVNHCNLDFVKLTNFTCALHYQKNSSSNKRIHNNEVSTLQCTLVSRVIFILEILEILKGPSVSSKF